VATASVHNFFAIPHLPVLNRIALLISQEKQVHPMIQKSIASQSNKLVYRGPSKDDVVKNASAGTRAVCINAAVFAFNLQL